MKILILNRIGLRHIPWAEILDGDTLYMISDVHAVADHDQARRSFKRLELVTDYERSGRVEQLAMAMHREIGFDRIVSVSEFDLLRAAKLRDLLGIEGQTFESALAFRNKLRMKDVVKAAGLSVPAYRRIDTPADILAFVEAHGPRVVIKPILGAGASHTYMIRSHDELDRVISDGIFGAAELPCSFEVESLIDGVMHHVDGIYQDGELVAIWPSVYVSPCHVYAQGIMHASHTLSPTNPLTARLSAFVKQLLTALPTPKACGFHAEIFHTSADELVLCEVASRVGGPRIPDLFRLATGFELVPAMIQAQAGRRVSAPPGGVRPDCVAGFMNIPAKSGVLEHAPTHCDVPEVVDYRLVGTIGERHAQSMDLGDFVSTFLFRANTEAAAKTAIFRTSEWFETSTRWAP